LGSSGRPSDGARPGDPARIAAALERAVAVELPPALPRQRWFGAKGRAITGARVRDCGPLGGHAWLTLVDVTFAQGPDETYAIPLVFDDAARVVLDTDASGALSLTLDLDGTPIRATDAFDHRGFRLDLLAGFERGSTVSTVRGGSVRFARTERFPRLPPDAPPASRRLTGEQSHTSVVFGGALILKALRKVQPGPNLEYEVGEFLTFRARFPHVPALAGAIEHASASGETTTLALLQRYVANDGDGWRWALEQLGRLPAEDAGEASEDVFGDLFRLGVVTAALHGALASDASDPAFAPEPLTEGDAGAWGERVADDVQRTCGAVRGRLDTVPRAVAADAQALLASEPALIERARDLRALAAEPCAKIRVHGDYHLGQTLRTEGGFVILDFEGEPARAVDERRRKQCALVDVAGMLRSLDYAVHTALSPAGASSPMGAPSPAAERWLRRANASFLEGYLDEIARVPVRLLPRSPAAFARALSIFELDRALYEVRYELDNRPAWLGIPLRGLARLLARERGG
jgi:maltose alpha-D-glucosyltransferase/alpha-amylase